MQFKKMPPKGARLNPQSKAIVAHLQAHGRQTFDQLHVLFREPSYHRSNGPNGFVPNPHWLRARLTNLRQGGHVSREVHEGVMYYVAGYQAGEQEPTSRQALAAGGCITPPRRVYVMQGGPYQPPPPAPCRDGAMDFAKCPSIEAGRRLPFTPGKAIYG